MLTVNPVGEGLANIVFVYGYQSCKLINLCEKKGTLLKIIGVFGLNEKQSYRSLGKIE